MVDHSKLYIDQKSTNIFKKARHTTSTVTPKMIPMMKTNTFGTQTNSPGRFGAKKTMIYHDEYTPRDEIINLNKLQRDKVKSSQGLHIPK